jgi:uncharacterized protein (DUF1810 family)
MLGKGERLRRFPGPLLARWCGALSKAFDKLMKGLDEAEAYLKGDVAGCRVHVTTCEDIQDVTVSRSRKREKSISLAKVKASLIASGKLRG